MPFSGEVQNEQTKISRLEAEAQKTDKNPGLKGNLAKNHKIFFGVVDGARTDLDAAQSTIKKPDNLQAVVKYKEDLKNFLCTAEKYGRQVLSKEEAGKERHEFSTALTIVDYQGEQINTRSAELKRAVPAFIAFENASALFKTKAKPVLDRVELIKTDQKLLPGEKRTLILEASQNAVQELGKAKSTISSIADLPPALRPLADEELFPIDYNLNEMAKISIQYESMDLANSKEYKKYVLINPQTGAVEFNEAGLKLSPQRKMEIMTAFSDIQQTVKNRNESKTVAKEHEKAYFLGKNLLLGGDSLHAKPELLKFYHSENGISPHTPDNALRLIAVKEYLKQIGLIELAQAEQRLNLLDSSVEAYTGELELKTPRARARIRIEQMRNVLAIARADLYNGNALTLDQAYERLKTSNDLIFQNSLKNDRQDSLSWFRADMREEDPIFDVLATQKEIGNIPDANLRHQKFIELGRKARKLGMFQLANQYYQSAFAQEIESKSKRIPKDEFENKMRGDGKFWKNLESKIKSWEKDLRDRFKDDYKNKFGFAPTKDAWKLFDETFAQNAAKETENISASLINDAYGKMIKTQVHWDFRNDPNRAGAAEWNEAYGKTFVNLQNFDQGNLTDYIRFWQYTDEELNFKKYQYIIDFALIIMAAMTAGATATLTVGARAAILEALGTAATTEAGEIALKRGGIFLARFVMKEVAAGRISRATAAKLGFRSLGEFAVESAAFTETEGVLNGVVRGDWTTYSSPEAQMKAWGHSVVMLGGCKAGSMGYRYATGSVADAIGVTAESAARRGLIKNSAIKSADAVLSTTTEITTMQGIQVGMILAGNDEVTPEQFREMLRENMVMIIGLAGAHHLTGAVSGERSEAAEAARLEAVRRGEAEPSRAVRELSKSADRAEAVAALKKANELRIKSEKKMGHSEYAELVAEARALEAEFLRLMNHSVQAVNEGEEDFGVARRRQLLTAILRIGNLESEYNLSADPDYLKLDSVEKKAAFLDAKAKEISNRILLDCLDPQTHAQVLALSDKQTGGSIKIKEVTYDVTGTSKDTSGLPDGWERNLLNDASYIAGKSYVLRLVAKGGEGGEKYFIVNARVMYSDMDFSQFSPDYSGVGRTYYSDYRTVKNNIRTIEQQLRSEADKEASTIHDRERAQRSAESEAKHQEHRAKEQERHERELAEKRALVNKALEEQRAEFARKQEEISRQRGEKDKARQERMAKEEAERRVSFEARMKEVEKKIQQMGEALASFKPSSKDPKDNPYLQRMLSFAREAWKKPGKTTDAAGNEVEINDLPPVERRRVISEKISAEADKIREEVATKQTLIAELGNELLTRVKENPDQIAEDLIEYAKKRMKEKGVSLYGSEMAQVQSSIIQLMAKRKAIKDFTAKHGNNPAKMFEAVFGYPPEGEVTVIVSTFSLNFQVKSANDFQKIYRDQTTSDVSENTMGFNMFSSKDPTLNGVINVIRGDRQTYDLQDVITHEERHAINKHIQPFDLAHIGLRIAVNRINSVKQLESICNHYIDFTLRRSQDEVSAYMTHNIPKDLVIEYLTRQNGGYDYWEDFAKGIKNEAISEADIRSTIAKYREIHNRQVRRMTEAAYQHKDSLLAMIPSPRELARKGRGLVSDKALEKAPSDNPKTEVSSGTDIPTMIGEGGKVKRENAPTRTNPEASSKNILDDLEPHTVQNLMKEGQFKSLAELRSFLTTAARLQPSEKGSEIWYGIRKYGRRYVDFYSNPAFQNQGQPPQGKYYRKGREINLPNQKPGARLFIHNIRGDDITLKEEVPNEKTGYTISNFYVVPRSIIEQYVPNTFGERVSGGFEKTESAISNALFRAKVSIKMFTSFGGLRRATVEGKKVYVLEPDAHIVFDQRQPEEQNITGAGNDYTVIFKAMKERGAKIIDLENIDRDLRLYGLMEGNELKIRGKNGRKLSIRTGDTPYITIDSSWHIQMLHHHRIMGAQEAGLPIIVNVTSADSIQ